MRELVEEFMDKWLDANVRQVHLRHPESLVARALARRCIADAEKAGVGLDALEEVVVDIEEAIGDELQLRAARAASK